MMKIYGWFSDTDNYSVVRGKTKSDRQALRFDSAIPAAGSTVYLEMVSDEHEPLGDFPSTGVAFPKCLSAKAFEALRVQLDNAGIIRDADVDGQRYFLFWPNIVVKCLDLNASGIEKLPSGSETLIKPEFTEGVEAVGPIFSVPEFRTQVLFVTEQFLTVAQAAELKGLELRTKFDHNAEVIRP